VVLDGYAQVLRQALPGNFVGLYLSGSLATGDFDLTSDVDLIVVSDRELDAESVERVQAAHSACISQDTRWVKHLEYSFFPLESLRTKSSPYLENGTRNPDNTRELWYFNNGSATIERSDHDNTLVTRWTLRNRSKVVLGTEPQDFAPEVTPNELRREIKNSMLGWGQLLREDVAPVNNRFYQSFLVLNNCRVLQDLHEGKITSKREGVDWAKQHLGPEWHSLIDFCWQERQDTGINVSQPSDPEVFKQTLAFMEHTTRLAEQYQLPTA